MARLDTGSTMIEAPILDLIKRERAKSLSPREWKFRLASHGLAIKDVKGGQVVTKLPQGVELGVLPTHLI